MAFLCWLAVMGGGMPGSGPASLGLSWPTEGMPLRCRLSYGTGGMRRASEIRPGDRSRDIFQEVFVVVYRGCFTRPKQSGFFLIIII